MKEFKNLCKKCMEKLQENTVCSKCGFDNDTPNSPYALTIGTLIEDRYKIGKDLTCDGEGIGYIAYDIETDTKVYIKEFFPQNLCDRKNNNVVEKEFFKQSFIKYKDKFQKYFRLIARLRAFNSLSAVYNIVSENNTSYVVQEWVEGITLKDYVFNNGGQLSWEDTSLLFMPLITSLSKTHSIGARHLGICPENLIITNENKIKLINFSIPELRQCGTPIKHKLYDGCSALEQYSREGIINDGTDVYGLSASMFFALTGEFPECAENREKSGELLISTSLLKSIPTHVISTIASGLQLNCDDRIESIEMFREELIIRPKVINRENNKDEMVKDDVIKSKLSSKIISILITCSLVFVIISVAIIVISFMNNKNNPNNVSKSNSVYELDINANTNKTNDKENNNENDVVKVPNLVGKNYKDVRKTYDAYRDYQVILQGEDFSSDYAEGCIINQIPKPGEVVTRGSSLIVTISKGSEMKKLPYITGMTLSEASKVLTGLKLIPEYKLQSDNTIPEGIVIGYENNKKDDEVLYGAKILILLSSGKE